MYYQAISQYQCYYVPQEPSIPHDMNNCIPQVMESILEILLKPFPSTEIFSTWFASSSSGFTIDVILAIAKVIPSIMDSLWRNDNGLVQSSYYH